MGLIDPCECRRARETAMACPRKSRGGLEWSPTSDRTDRTGPITVVTPEGERETLTFGREWAHFDELLARGHANIRHLDFVEIT